MSTTALQAQVVAQSEINPLQAVQPLALFDAEGNAINLSTIEGFAKAADVAAVATVNATDLPTVIALVNQLKTTVNSLLTALKAANLEA